MGGGGGGFLLVSALKKGLREEEKTGEKTSEIARPRKIEENWIKERKRLKHAYVCVPLVISSLTCSF